MIVFDLDGTLALIEHRRHFVEGETKDWPSFFAACVDDIPNAKVLETLELYVFFGDTQVEIWSGRSDEVEAETRAWLSKHGINPERLTRMRKSGDHQPDDKLKRGWLNEVRASGDDVELAFDDRNRIVDMWRSEGIPCFQVAAGDF